VLEAHADELAVLESREIGSTPSALAGRY